MSASGQRAAVVGAGVGGLAAAARLAARGLSVDVFEKLPECGGRAHIIEDSGFKFDTGPSFILMPDFFREVFAYCGEEAGDYLDLKVLDTSYRIFYPDGKTLTVFRDREKTRQEFERFEPGAGRALDAFIDETELIYSAVRPLLYKNFVPRDLLRPALWPLVTRLNPLATYWQMAAKHFKSEQLCYAMTFEAMFIGVSPFATPGFYSVITYADHVQKISHPMGGMYRVPLALEQLGRNRGVRFHYNAEVEKIRFEGGQAVLRTRQGETASDVMVVNADYAASQTDLLGRRVPRYDYSCSVYLMYLGLKKKVAGLEHHNLFFSKDLRRNLRQIFRDKTAVDDPSFYVHVPTVTDAALAPPGKDIFYILAPVPNLDGNRADMRDYEQRLREMIFGRIDSLLGIRLEDLIEVEHRFYPEDFITRYNIKHGATFGLAHTLRQSAFFRPSNRDPRHKNLFYAGASTQPGGGLPPVIASSRIVADMICGG